jgi:hypothetical protein
MSDSSWPFISKLAPIPPIFHSLLKDGMFTHCLDCDRELLESHTDYMIERVFRGTEPIMEYAMCLKCREQLSRELSVESGQRIEAFVQERVVFEDRIEKMWQSEGVDAERWIDECLISKERRSECSEYQIVAACRGANLFVGPLPIMISGKAAREIGKLLSKKTRDRLGEFSSTHFGMPPEFCDNPNTPILF